MIQFLRRLFSRKPSVSKSRSSFSGSFVGTAIEAGEAQHTESDTKKAVEKTASLPKWYIENCDFESLNFLHHSASLRPPRISPEVRSALKTYVHDVCPEPSSALLIYQKMSGKDVSVRDVAKYVSSDPLLAAHILKVVNSGAFYTQNVVTSVGRAVTLLGLHNVRNIVLSQTIRSSLGSLTGKDMHKKVIQEHSAMVSSIAMILSDDIASVDQYEASTIGLMHDIGKILLPLVEERGKKIITNVETPTEIIESLLASTFAEIWGLPQSIIDAIQYTSYPFFYPIHSVPEEYQPLVSLVAASNVLAKALGFSDGELHYLPDEAYTNLINLNGAPEFWLTPGIIVMIEKSRQTLEM